MALITTDWTVVGGPLRCELGESPVSDPATGRLVVVDVTGLVVHAIESETGQVESTAVARRVTAVVARAGGGWLAVAGRDIVPFDLRTGAFGTWLSLPGPEDVALNDAVVGRDGILYTGSIDRSGGRGGEFYAVDPGGRITVLATGVGASNGVDTSPDGRIVYHADTFAGTVTAYTAGRVGRILAQVAVQRPDGLAVDADGGVWVAHWGYGEVRRYTAALVPDRTAALPVPLVSNLAFGGPGLRRMFVTSARSGGNPLSGAIFTATAGIPGLTAVPFPG